MIAAALARTSVSAEIVRDRPDRDSRLRQQRRRARVPRPRRPLDRPDGPGARPPVGPRFVTYPNHVLHWIDDAETAFGGRRLLRQTQPARRPHRRPRRARRSGRRAPRRRRRGAPRRVVGPAGGAESAAKCSARVGDLLRAREKDFADDRADRNRQAVEERRRGSRLVRRSRDVHGRRGQPLLRQDDDEPDRESQRADAAHAHRDLCRDHAVQQPAGRHRVESVSGAAVRQCRRRQVARADAVHGDPVRSAAERRGPAARVSTVSCRASAREVGTPLVQDSRIGLVSFTGSASTGKLIQRLVSERPVLAKVCLELGGKNPLVVCDDADLDLAAEHAVASAFIDAGQRCAAGSRIIVFDAVYDAFRDEVPGTRRRREGRLRSAG